MISLLSYLTTIFAGLFLIARTIIAICYSLGIEIGIVPLNFNTEIVLLFLSLICIILIIKRNAIGAIIYFAANGMYFGNDLLKTATALVNNESISLNYFSLILSFLGIVIPTFTVVDIIINKERKGGSKDGKTDWFFSNKDYDRKHDERADENQYKF